MWKYIIFVVLQALSLAGGQAMFKKFIQKVGDGGWVYSNLKAAAVGNWWILVLMVLFFGMSFVLWAYVLKKMDFSQAYPLSSLSFIFGMFLYSFCFRRAYPSPVGLAWCSSWWGVS
jgi:multidrug transporter EmrE-like cation transporter